MRDENNKAAHAESENEIDKTFKKHRKILDHNREMAGKIKESGKKVIEKTRELPIIADRIERDADKKQKMLDEMKKIKRPNLERTVLPALQEQREREESLSGSLSTIYSDLSEAEIMINQVTISSGSAEIMSGVSLRNMGTPVVESDTIDLNVKETIEKLMKTDTLDRSKKYIREVLDSDYHDIAEEFDEAIKRWVAATSQEEMKSVLQSLRRIIYDSLFEKQAKQSDYTKTSWHDSSRKKFRKELKERGVRGVKRALQSKYIMIGATDEKEISSSLIDRVDKQSMEMERIYSGLSDVTHENYRWKLKNLYEETINTLADVLRIGEKL